MAKSSVAGLISTQTAIKRKGGDIAKSAAVAGKEDRVIFVQNTVGSKNNSESVIEVKVLNTIQEPGPIISTKRQSDLAISGEGFFPVRSDDGTISYTKDGTFRVVDGKLVNAAGKTLTGYTTDEEGNLPPNAGLVETLQDINLQVAIGDPRATTRISFAGMNLTSKAKPLEGAGPELTMKIGKNTATGKTNQNDVIFPDVTTNGGALRLGDKFTVRSLPKSLDMELEFGGMSIGRAATNGAPLYGATTSIQKFTFGAGANQIQSGATLRITVGGVTKTFTVKQGTVDPTDGDFNSLSSLAKAINATGELSARLDNAGAIYIAAKDANKEITFANGGGGQFVEKLGLYDVAAAAGNVKRFNSLFNLKEAVNSGESTHEIMASIEKGKIKLSSLKATDDFEMNVVSNTPRQFKTTVIGNGTIKGQATAQILSPGSGLQAGDLIRLTGLGAAYGSQLDDGIYTVSSVDDAIGFTVHLIIDDMKLGAGVNKTDGPAAVGPSNVITTNTGSWEKIVGGTDLSAASLTNQAVASSTLGPAFTVTFNTAAPGAVGDVIYVSTPGGVLYDGANKIDIPDGYYIVQATTAGSFTINPRSVAVDPTLGNTNIQYKKIGVTENAGALFNTNNGITSYTQDDVIRTPAGIGNTYIELLYRNYEGYAAGDLISFNNLPNPYTIDGITLANDTKYRIRGINGDYLQIEEAFTPPAVATWTTAAGNISSRLSGAALPALPVDFKINHFGKTLEYFGITDQTEATYLKTYDPDDISKNLAGGVQPTQYTENLTLFDNLGEDFNLNLRFAKLDDSTWAVELVSTPDKNGNYNVELPQAGSNLIAAGTITFDGGKILDIKGDVGQPITVFRKNGAAPVEFTLDFRGELGGKGNAITQYGSASKLDNLDQDGYGAGNVTDYSIDTQGRVSMVFDNGNILKIYQILLATFPNPAGLQAGIGGTYSVTSDSGRPLFKRPGQGAGEIISSALENSNINPTETLVQLQQYSILAQQNARVIGVENKTSEKIMSEI